jgi:FkbM family methyltransferase
MEYLPYTITLSNHIRFDVLIPPKAIEERKHDFVTRLLANGRIPGDDEEIIRLIVGLVRPGGIVLDLGAHLGAISLAAAAAGYRVLAVDASPENVASLQASISHNRFAQMEVVQAAVSDHPGTLEFMPHGPFGLVANPKILDEYQLPSVKVRAVTIDDLLSEKSVERVDFIKMDIEGSEVAAIRGAGRLLSRPDAPPIVYESNGCALGMYGTDTRHLRRTLEGFGYCNYLIDGVLRPVRANDVQPDAVANYLALKELPPSIQGWRFEGPFCEAEIVQRVLSLCAAAGVDKQWGYRQHLINEISGPPAWLLSHRRVKKALHTLQIRTYKDMSYGWIWWLKYNLADLFGKVLRRVRRLGVRTRRAAKNSSPGNPVGSGKP